MSELFDYSESTLKDFQTAEEAVAWIVGLVPFGIRPGLKRMEWMMEQLGNPERKLKFIHVAGTNGKGSTCAYLSEVLIQCGYDVGTFTSPYLEKYTNRIRYNGNDIGEAALVSLTSQIKSLADQLSTTDMGPLTMFEASTCLAICYFAKVVFPDYVVLETGLGGRLDSTNIVTPIVTVITNVGHDHMEILGDTLAKVAGEKAGIIKSGVPIVSAVEQPEVIEVIEEVAGNKHCSMYLMGKKFHFEAAASELDHQQFHFNGPFRRLENVTISLNGSHQMKNAAVAIMTLEVLRQYYALIVDDEDLYRALESTKWPGRLEMLMSSPRLLVDGAHNPEGAETLANALRHTYNYRKLHLMMAMLSTKNHRAYLMHILPLVDTLIITEVDFRKKMDADAFRQLTDEVLQEMDRHIEIIVERDWKKALKQLLELTGEQDLAVVSGTLYLISDIRSWVLNQSDSEKGW